MWSGGGRIAKASVGDVGMLFRPFLRLGQREGSLIAAIIAVAVKMQDLLAGAGKGASWWALRQSA